MDYTWHQMHMECKVTVRKTVTITQPDGQTVAQPVRCWSHIGGTEEYELSDGTVLTVITKVGRRS